MRSINSYRRLFIKPVSIRVSNDLEHLLPILSSSRRFSSSKNQDLLLGLSTSRCQHYKIHLQVSSNNYQLQLRRHFNSQVRRPYVDPKVSYVYGRSSEHLIYTTIASELEKKIESCQDGIAYIIHSENKKVTFKQLDHDINKLAKALLTKYGIKKGDFIGVFAYNCYNWIVIQLVCSRLGAILAPINPSFKSVELAYVLKKGKIKCLFMPGPKSVQSELNNHMKVLQSDEIISMSKANELLLENVILLDGENQYEISYEPDERNIAKNDKINFRLANCRLSNWIEAQSDGKVYKSLEEAKQNAVLDLSEATIINSSIAQPEDLFAVYYTSGTTGKPKGACVSQFTVMNNVNLCQNRLRNGQKDTKIVAATTLPMFHIFAGVLNTLGPICANTTVVYSSYKYDLKAYLDSIIENNAYCTTLTPTMLIDMLSYIEANKLSSKVPLKLIQPGGAALAPELVTKTFKMLPQLEEVRTGYGSTENGAVATFQTIHEPSDKRPDTVGPPIDFTEIRIVKPNTDTIVPIGVQGEIQTRGHNTMTCYLDDPEKTDQVFTKEGRWYKTGDIGFVHPHGSLQVSGRLKHMIIKGGENIYPEEVEQIIHKMSCIEKVHVVGVPDERFGEQVCAWVKLRSDYRQVDDRASKRCDKDVCKEDIIDYCKQNMTYFKVPKYLLFVDDFPMTPTKKVQAHIMVEESIKILGLKN